MNIKDEAVPQAAKLAAVEAYTKVHGSCRPVAMTAALTAALPHMGGVSVKPLEWETETKADTLIGTYHILAGRARFAVMLDGVSVLNPFHDTLEEAKAAAQADYERRILSALASHEPAPEICATEGCENPATHWRGKFGVGSFYCEACDGKIARQSKRPAPEPAKDGT